MKLSTMISLLAVLAILPQGLIAEDVQKEEAKILLPLKQVAELTVTRGEGPGKPIVGLKIWAGSEHRRLSKDFLVPLKELKHLRSLEIDGSEIDPAAFTSLKDLTEFQILTLSMTVTDATLAGLKGLTRLCALDFWASKVSDDGLANLEQLTHLESLRMYGAKKITDAGLAHLADLVQLRNLSWRAARSVTTDWLICGA